MPIMDGWTASAEIFKRYPVDKRPNIIAMTGMLFSFSCSLSSPI